MANNMRITIDEKCAMAYDFVLADDLYLFFKFKSPDSDCEIGIAYDCFVDGGDWYVNDGRLGEDDYKIVDDIIWNKLPENPDFWRFDIAANKAAQSFNKVSGKYPSYTVDGADYIFGYGVSGGIQSALEDVIWSLYVGICERVGTTPVNSDKFYGYYQEEAGRMLAAEVERDFAERFGLEW